jgi:hypothetical protein
MCCFVAKDRIAAATDPVRQCRPETISGSCSLLLRTTSLFFHKMQLDTEDELSANPGILLSSEFRAIAGDLIAQVSAQFGFKKHLDP